MKQLSTTKSVVTRVLILIALSWGLFGALISLPGCGSQKTGCHSVTGKNYKVGY